MINQRLERYTKLSLLKRSRRDDHQHQASNNEKVSTPGKATGGLSREKVSQKGDSSLGDTVDVSQLTELEEHPTYTYVNKTVRNFEPFLF